MESFKIKYSKWLINWMAKPTNVNIGDGQNLVFWNQQVAKASLSVIWKKSN